MAVLRNLCWQKARHRLAGRPAGVRAVPLVNKSTACPTQRTSSRLVTLLNQQKAYIHTQIHRERGNKPSQNPSFTHSIPTLKPTLSLPSHKRPPIQPDPPKHTNHGLQPPHAKYLSPSTGQSKGAVLCQQNQLPMSHAAKVGTGVEGTARDSVDTCYSIDGVKEDAQAKAKVGR